MPRFSLTMVTMFLLAGALAWAADDAAKVPDPKPIALKHIRGVTSETPRGVYTILSAEDLVKFLKQADPFDRAVNFNTEDLILVHWESSGPPFGKLTYKTDKTTITFTVEEPQVEIRGQSYKQGNDWFTIAKGTKVVLEK